jgi:hypothetical protein
MKPGEGIKVYDTALSTMWFDMDGIFCSVTKKNASLTKEALMESFDYIRCNSTSSKICWLGDVTAALFPTQEARDFAGEETPKFVKALALITNSEISRMIANVFMVLKKPSYPTRMFTNEEDAKEWLRQYLDKMPR